MCDVTMRNSSFPNLPKSVLNLILFENTHHVFRLYDNK